MTRVAALVMVAALAAAPSRAADGAARVAAEAGLGGLSKPGRWTPVRVGIDATGTDLVGEIRVDWGTARARRVVTVASGSHKQVEVFIRTPDFRDAIIVRLFSNGREIASAEAPIRVARPEDAITVCVASANAWSAAAGCSATLTPRTLPHSWRGYDAADNVVWQPEEATGLARDQQTAITAWQAVRALEDAGGSPSVPPVAAGNPNRVAIAGIAVYLLAIAAAGFALTRSRARSLALYPAIGLLVVLASAAALAAGRVGPGTDIRVRYRMVVQQLPGATGSFVVLRGVAEFPSFDTFALRALRADGAIEPSGAGGGPDLRYDEDGAPLLTGTAGLGAAKTFELEAMTDVQVLTAARNGRVVRVSNRSLHTVSDCQFPPGFSKGRVGSLASSQAVEAEEGDAVDDRSFTCTLSAPIVEFAEAHRRVTSEGAAVVTLRLPAGNREP